MTDVTRLLEAATRGDRQAAAELLPLGAGILEVTGATFLLARVGLLDRSSDPEGFLPYTHPGTWNGVTVVGASPGR